MNLEKFKQIFLYFIYKLTVLKIKNKCKKLVSSDTEAVLKFRADRGNFWRQTSDFLFVAELPTGILKICGFAII